MSLQGKLTTNARHCPHLPLEVQKVQVVDLVLVVSISILEERVSLNLAYR